MNITIKKTVIAAALMTGIAGSLTLQAHENSVAMNHDSMTGESASMSMDMTDKKGMMGKDGMMQQMMGNSEQRGRMMAACSKMMAAFAKGDHESTSKDKTQE